MFATVQSSTDGGGAQPWWGTSSSGEAASHTVHERDDDAMGGGEAPPRDGFLDERIMGVLRAGASSLPPATALEGAQLVADLGVQCTYLAREYVEVLSAGMPRSALHEAASSVSDILPAALIGLSSTSADHAGVRGALRVERALWRATGAVCGSFLPAAVEAHAVALAASAIPGGAAPLGDGLAWEGVLLGARCVADPHAALLSAVVGVLGENARDDARELVAAADSLGAATAVDGVGDCYFDNSAAAAAGLQRPLGNGVTTDPDATARLDGASTTVCFAAPGELTVTLGASPAVVQRVFRGPALALWQLARCGRVAFPECAPPSDGGVGALEVTSFSGAPWLAAAMLSASPRKDELAEGDVECDAIGFTSTAQGATEFASQLVLRRGNVHSASTAAMASSAVGVVTACISVAQDSGVSSSQGNNEAAAVAAVLQSLVAGCGSAVLATGSGRASWQASTLVHTFDDAAWCACVGAASARSLTLSLSQHSRVCLSHAFDSSIETPVTASCALLQLKRFVESSAGGLATVAVDSPYSQCLFALVEFGEAIAAGGASAAGVAGSMCLQRWRDIVLGTLPGDSLSAIFSSRAAAHADAAISSAAHSGSVFETPAGDAFFRPLDTVPSPDALLVSTMPLLPTVVPLLRWGAHAALMLLRHSPLAVLGTAEGHGSSHGTNDGIQKAARCALDDLLVAYARHLASISPRESHAEAVLELARHCTSRTRAVRLLASYVLTLPYHHPPEEGGGSIRVQLHSPRLEFLAGAALVTEVTFGGAWGSDIVGSALRHAVGVLITGPAEAPSQASASSGMYGLVRRPQGHTQLDTSCGGGPLGGLPFPQPPPHLPAAARAAGLSLNDFVRCTALQWLGAGPQKQDEGQRDLQRSPYLHYCVGAANALSRLLAVQSAGRDADAAASARAALLLLHCGLPTANAGDTLVKAFLSVEAREAQAAAACAGVSNVGTSGSLANGGAAVLCAVAGEARCWSAYAQVLRARAAWVASTSRGLPSPPLLPAPAAATPGSLARAAEEMAVARALDARGLHARVVAGTFLGAPSARDSSGVCGSVADATTALHAAIVTLVTELTMPMPGTRGCLLFSPDAPSGALIFSPSGSDGFVTPLSLPSALPTVLPAPRSIAALLASHAAAWLAESALQSARWLCGDPIAAALYEAHLRDYLALAERAWDALHDAVAGCDVSATEAAGTAMDALHALLPAGVLAGLKAVRDAAAAELSRVNQLLPRWKVELP